MIESRLKSGSFSRHFGIIVNLLYSEIYRSTSFPDHPISQIKRRILFQDKRQKDRYTDRQRGRERETSFVRLVIVSCISFHIECTVLPISLYNFSYKKNDSMMSVVPGVRVATSRRPGNEFALSLERRNSAARLCVYPGLVFPPLFSIPMSRAHVSRKLDRPLNRDTCDPLPGSPIFSVFPSPSPLSVLNIIQNLRLYMQMRPFNYIMYERNVNVIHDGAILPLLSRSCVAFSPYPLFYKIRVYIDSP